jgi:hypothetical protein
MSVRRAAGGMAGRIKVEKLSEYSGYSGAHYLLLGAGTQIFQVGVAQRVDDSGWPLPRGQLLG